MLNYKTLIRKNEKALCIHRSVGFGVIFSQNVKDSVASRGIEDVVIVASRKPTKISEIPGTVWVVQKEKNSGTDEKRSSY